MRASSIVIADQSSETKHFCILANQLLLASKYLGLVVQKTPETPMDQDSH
jgi:hypothetical protein